MKKHKWAAICLAIGSYFLNSAIASSELGLPVGETEIDWKQSQWIGYTEDDRPDKWAVREVAFNRPPHDISSWEPTEAELRSIPRKAFVSPLLRKEFFVDKRVDLAKVAVSGLGLYELWLNGSKVGDHVLAPAQTSYDKRAFYNVFDVTDQLKQGENAIGIMLGNGFYGQNIAFAPNLSYGPPRARLLMFISYTDGSTRWVASDESWRAKIGPILFDNVFMGETYDARRFSPGWSTAVYNDSVWSQVEIMQDPGRLVEQQLEPMRKTRKLKPVDIFKADDGWIVDMGENMTGWLELSFTEPEGTEVQMRFAEHLMPDGKSVDTASTGIHATGGEQIDIYICRGGGVETWEPRFTYHGFRYVQITGLSRKPSVEELTGWWVRTDVDSIGSFESSDPLINTFYDVSMRTIEGNLQGLLSDCPHRERCAWMGDIHAVAEAASYNYDLRQFWRKTARDIQSVLGAAGSDPRVPGNVAVGKRLCDPARPDWGAATVLLPWFAYLHYGDLDLVKESWSMMEGWMEYLHDEQVEDGIINDGFGDWCPPGSNTKKDTPAALTSTALYFQTLEVMQFLAKKLGKHAQAKLYAERAAHVKDAFNERFFVQTEVPVEIDFSDLEIVIEHAQYGSGMRTVDLTDKVQTVVDEGYDHFKMSNSFVGKDPAPGRKKQLQLEYTIDGRPYSKVLKENENVLFASRSIDNYGSQTGSVIALHVGLVPEDKEASVAAGLSDLIMETSEGRYTTGILGHRPLYTVLNDYGYGSVTSHLWSLTDWPSLGFMTEVHDLTTWPEVPYNWQEGRRYRRNSFNHPMHSGFAATFHESLGGIRPDPEHPGYKQFILRPTFLPNLEWIKTSLRSPQGLISSQWKRQGEQVLWEVVVPDNTSAQVQLDAYKSSQISINGKPTKHNRFTLESGDWSIELH